ncbi:OmpA family protein [bacterium]|nr:OmpA family protein [bacterium]
MKKHFFCILSVCILSSFLLAQPTYWGTSGLIRTVSADNFGKGYLTISVHGNYYQTNLNNQIIEGALTDYTQRHSNSYISAAFSPLCFLEISGGISGLLVSDKGIYGNDPTQFGFGDTYSGLKLSYTPWWWITIGGYGYLTWPTGSAILKDSLFTETDKSFAGLGLLTFDFTSDKARFPLPLRLHFNFGYIQDHSITSIFESAFPGREDQHDDQYIARAGIEIPAGYFDLFCDFSTEQSTRELVDFGDNPMCITPGIRFNSDWFSTDFGVDIGLGNKGVQDVRHIDNMEWKLTAGVSFMTRLIQEPPQTIYGKLTGSIIDVDKGSPLIAMVTSDDTTMKAPFITKKDGIYTIWLTKGAHNVTYSANGYETFTKSVIITDSIGIALDVALRPLRYFGTLTGKVTDVVSGEIVDADVMIVEEKIKMQVDSQTGIYRGQAKVGTYTLTAEAEGYHPVSEVAITEKDKTTVKDFQLRPLITATDGELTGNVVDVRTGEGISASINVETPGFAPIMSENITGSYKMTLPSGSWTVMASKDGYQTATQTAVIKIGETTVQKIELRPIPMSIITGKVINIKDGLSLTAEISFTDSDIPSIKANKNGIYNISIMPGTYEIEARYEGFIPQVFPIIAEADKSIIRDFELVKAGEKITLKGIFFDFNRASIKPESKPALDKAIKIMTDNPGVRVRIEGHTDSVGSDSYNQKLSQKRADSVKVYLVKSGDIDAARIISMGRGELEPIASNENDEGRSLNRRIEFVILK